VRRSRRGSAIEGMLGLVHDMPVRDDKALHLRAKLEECSSPELQHHPSGLP
jgi:hypothetical protein